MLRIAYQSVNASAHLDTNQRLSDLQVSQVMTFVSGSHSIDSVKSLQYCTFMRNRNRSRFVPTPEPFWLTPKFQTWKSARDSSLVMLRGNHTSRLDLKDFCVNAISLLRDSKVPVLWALKTIKQDAVEALSVVDLLKDLVSQALRVNEIFHTERSMALSCMKFQRAETEMQWLELLGFVLAGLPHVYIIIDVEAVSPRLGSFGCYLLMAHRLPRLLPENGRPQVQDCGQSGPCKLWFFGTCRLISEGAAGSHDLSRTTTDASYDSKRQNSLAARFSVHGERVWSRSCSRPGSLMLTLGLTFRQSEYTT